jgi:FkbM family methyltransferase
MKQKKRSFIKRLIQGIERRIKIRVRLFRARKQGFRFVAPNFIYLPHNLSSNSVVIDAGCSYQADFSLYMINAFGVKSYAVDPTRKHGDSLRKLEEQYKNRLSYLPLAISAKDSTLTFHESKTNESGSILERHLNIQRDETVSYTVESLSIKSLLNRIHAKEIEILKLDLEGAEYELLSQVQIDELCPIKQMFVEFHHHAVDLFSEKDTLNLVEKIKKFGFKSISLDDHNYLFYRQHKE